VKGPRTFDEWTRAYSARIEEYAADPGEKVRWHPTRGFFSYWYDAENRELVIPKVCGDGGYWRGVIYEMVRAAGPEVCRGVLCRTKRNPMAFTRFFGGKIRGLEYTFDFETKKKKALWLIFITPDDWGGRARARTRARGELT
jgi:hypothetical protein